MGKGPAAAAAAGMPAISAPRGTKEFRRQIAAREEWVKDVAEQGGWAALEKLGIANEEGMGRGIYRTYGPGGYFSQYGGAYNTNFIYDWGSGRKLNIATNAEAFPGEAVQNSQGQWVFDPNKASAERWEAITPDEYAGYQQQQQWGAQNPGANTYADMLSHQRLMRDVKQGHLTKDPRSGNYYNIRPDGSVEWKDKYGRPIGGGGASSSMFDSQGGGYGGGNFISSYSNFGAPKAPAGGGSYGYGQGWARYSPDVTMMVPPEDPQSGGGGIPGQPNPNPRDEIFPPWQPNSMPIPDDGSPNSPQPGLGPGPWLAQQPDYSGILGPYMGQMAQMQQILNQQAQLDLFNQNMGVRDAWNNRMQAAGMENYLTDFYGDIMGVDFDPVDTSGVSDYFDQWAQNPLPQPGYTPGAPGGMGTPSAGGAPTGGPPSGGWKPPVSGGPPGTVYEEPPEGMTPQEYWNAQNGFPTGTPSWFTEWVNSGGAPWNNGVGWPGQPGYGGSVNVPQMGSLPPAPPLPEFSPAQGGGYHKKDVNFDPSNSASWGLLAMPAQGISADMNAQIERLKRELPEGGERNAAIANATQRGYGSVAGARQSLVTDALSGISALMNQKKYGVPIQPQSGAGLGMFGNLTSMYGADRSAAASKYAADLGYRSSLYNTNKNYQLGLQQLKSKGNPWGTTLGIIGGLGGALLGGPAGAMAGYSIGSGVGG